MPDTNSPSTKDAAEERLGTVHENLEGWIPSTATESEIRAALERAFDYRGVFDRKSNGPSLSDCLVRLMPKEQQKDQPGKLSVPYSDIAALAFTGRDTAAGKSFAAWVKKYNEKKAAGEKNIGIDSDPLE